MKEQKKSPVPFFKLYSGKDKSLDNFISEGDFKTYGIIIMLLKHIYGSHGYYTDINSQEFLSFKKDNCLRDEEMDRVLKSCLEKNLFDEILFSKYKILTSVSIQRNWQDVAKSEKIYGYKINPEYLLLYPDEEILHISEYDSICLALAD